MPARKFLRCTDADCDRPAKALGLCKKHYMAHQRKLKPNYSRPKRPQGQKAVPVEVVALYAYPDTNRGAPHGQRLAVYRCPACKGEHLVAWGLFDADPGEKITSCRGASGGVGGKTHRVFVKAPEGGVSPAGYGEVHVGVEVGGA